MTDPDDRTHMPMPMPPPDDFDFDVETEAMVDGRRIQYYRWPEPATPQDETSEDARV